MINVSRKTRDDDLATLRTAKAMRIVICEDDQTTTPPTAQTDLYIYKGTTALSSSNYIKLPTGCYYGHRITIKSLNGIAYVQSDAGIISLNGSTSSTSTVNGSTYTRSYIYTRLGWVMAYS